MGNMLECKNYEYNTSVGKIKYRIHKRKLLGKKYFTGYIFLDKNIFTKKFIIKDMLQHFPFFEGYTIFDEYNGNYEIGFDAYYYPGDKLFRTFKDVEKYMRYVIDCAVKVLKEDEV